MSIPLVPPPTYSRQSTTQPHTDDFSDAQLLISSPHNSSTFQRGYLGVTDERPAIEGEIQIKGVPVDSWQSVLVALLWTDIS